MQPPSTATKTITPYERQAREAALAWSRLALSTNDPAFDIHSSQQHDLHGTILGLHRLSVEHQIRRWCGSVGASSDDIVCRGREEFVAGLEQQGLLALYDKSAHHDLTESITGAQYAALNEPSYRPIRSRRLRYHQQCGDCHASGAQTCPTCRGDGETTCGSCAGAGDETCSSCGGSGQEDVGHNDSHGHHHTVWANCPTCNGNGHVDCGGCGGSGHQTCGTCHRTGRVSCASCEGTGCFTHIGQVALLHTPTYQAAFDDGTPDVAHHVLNFFGHAGLAEPATVILESINRVDDTPATATLEFRYRFQLPAAQLKVKSRREILGSGDYSQWSVVGKTPEVIDCDHALFPLLMGASIDLQRMTGWRSAWRLGYNQRVSGELSTVLKPAVHQWIVDAFTRNRSVEEIEIEIRRALDPLSIAAIASNVTHALNATYRRCMVLHQGAAMLITLLWMLMTSETSNRFMHGLLAGLPNQGIALRVRTGIAVASTDGAPWVFLAVIAILIIISFHVRHRAWLGRAGGDVLWARAVSLGQLNLRAVSLQILGAMLLAALLTQAVMTGR